MGQSTNFQRPTRRYTLAAAAAAAAVPKPSHLAPYLQMLPSLLQAVIMAVLGYVFTGQIDQALKERKATVDSVKEMTGLLTEINKASGNYKEDTRQQLARQLSMYGVDAIGPLIVLAVSKDMEMSVPAQGLLLIAVSHKDEVCAALGNLSKSKSQFPDRTAQIEFLEDKAKELGCKQAK